MSWKRTTFEAVAAARDAAVVAGLHAYVPEICDELAALARPCGRRPTSCRSRAGSFSPRRGAAASRRPLLSAWLAVNWIREWRGDTHWAIQVAEGIGEVEGGILDGAWRGYADDGLPRSRGADDASSPPRSPSSSGAGRPPTVRSTPAASTTASSWRIGSTDSRRPRGAALGEQRTNEFLDLVEPVGSGFIERIDPTAGPNWMPAARNRAWKPTESEERNQS